MKQLAFDNQPTRGTTSKQYWLMPPELYKRLDDEFHFDFDPCPFPRQGFDGLKTDWGMRSFVNPPYDARDGPPYSKWVYKSIEEYRKGKTVVLLHPMTSCDYALFSLRPELIPLGLIKWVATDGSGDTRSSRYFMAVVLRGEH